MHCDTCSKSESVLTNRQLASIYWVSIESSTTTVHDTGSVIWVIHPGLDATSTCNDLIIFHECRKGCLVWVTVVRSGFIVRSLETLPSSDRCIVIHLACHGQRQSHCFVWVDIVCSCKLIANKDRSTTLSQDSREACRLLGQQTISEPQEIHSFLIKPSAYPTASFKSRSAKC